MLNRNWLQNGSPAFRLLIATSWLAPDPYREDQDEAIHSAIAANVDWPEYLRLVQRHGVPGLGWAALRRAAETSIPEAVTKELRQHSDACHQEALLYCALLARVLKQLNSAGIAAMPLKGQILSQELYGDVGLRLSRDLDLVVPIDSLDRAQDLIAGKDWRLESTFFPMSRRQWESFLANEQHVNYVHSRLHVLLELHWRFQWESQEDTRTRWARSVPKQWQDCSIRAMHPGDMALYLCSHGGLHTWFRAKWLGDLARAHAMGLLDWETSLEQARRNGQERILLAGLQLLDEVYGLPVPQLADADRSPMLVQIPLEAMQESKEPEHAVGPAKLRNRMRLARYERILWPRKKWLSSLSELFYGREDYRTLPLPDSFFWLYKPLRPVLWTWRWLMQK